jgi:HTH domain.
MSEELQSSDHDKKTLRSEYPSGWLVLTKNESVPYIVDALLDAPPHREFNQTELAEHAGVSRQSVSRYLDLLEDIGDRGTGRRDVSQALPIQPGKQRQ